MNRCLQKHLPLLFEVIYNFVCGRVSMCEHVILLAYVTEEKQNTGTHQFHMSLLEIHVPYLLFEHLISIYFGT